MLDRDSFEAAPPSQFLALPASDQRQKLRRRREIETTWQCDIRECIPAEIRPRQNFGGRGTNKAKIGEQVEAKEWWQWGMDFMTKVGKIAFMTAGKLSFSQDLMTLEVQDRQRGTGKILMGGKHTG